MLRKPDENSLGAPDVAEPVDVPIVGEIERRTSRSVARAAVYITPRRLEEKGFVSSWMSEPVAERGGKGRRYAKLEAEGIRALREARRASERRWRGLAIAARLDVVRVPQIEARRVK